jgi:hypothetical protein
MCLGPGKAGRRRGPGASDGDRDFSRSWRELREEDDRGFLGRFRTSLPPSISPGAPSLRFTKPLQPNPPWRDPCASFLKYAHCALAFKTRGARRRGDADIRDLRCIFVGEERDGEVMQL